MDNKPLSLTTLEEYLGVCRRTLFRWIKDGQLPAIKMGGRWVVREDDLELFLKRRLFFLQNVSINMFYFRPEVLEQYRKSPDYYVDEAAFHGRVGRKEDRYKMHNRSSNLRWTKTFFGGEEFQDKEPRHFAGLRFWKVRLNYGWGLVVDPREFAHLPDPEQSKWQPFQIHKPLF